MDKRKTAVEWFVEMTEKLGHISPDIIEQSKKMEKENISKAFYDGYYQEELYDCRKYYDETYNSQDETEYLLSTDENRKRLDESILQIKSRDSKNTTVKWSNPIGIKKQTVVTWLISELIRNRLMALRYDSDNTANEILEKANRIFEDQIIQAYKRESEYAKTEECTDETIDERSIKYYKETYGK
jgi:hypothetical protein